ncbi:MAG: MBL fold metallo-hydrolase, partial [Deltaproteobacteria bacterium]|nr:MBL fold metallo-hydrolase [Deltaproteobacteria bacterium]
MKVKFWGTRGSIPVPGKDTIVYGGNTTCLEMTLESGSKVIIDAGTGIRPLGRELNAMEEDVDIHLLITHIHWDHVLGFPFFDPVYEPTTKIALDGFPTCIKGLKIPFDNRMGDGFWPIKFDDLKAEIQYLDTLSHGPLSIDNTVIDTIPLQHPQGGFGFRFREGKKTLVFITDNELDENAWSGRRPEDYARFCQDADILIHDAQYTPDEWKNRKGWGHSDYVTTVNLAAAARVKRLVLYHHDPSRKDPELSAIEALCEELAKEMNVDVVIDAAREGSELT